LRALTCAAVLGVSIIACASPVTTFRDSFGPPVPPPCALAPLPEVAWVTHRAQSLDDIAVPLPPGFRRDSSAPNFARFVGDSSYGVPLATVEITTYDTPEDTLPTTTYIDGVPVTPGGRGSHGPRPELVCRCQLLGAPARVEHRVFHGYGTLYGTQLLIDLPGLPFLRVNVVAISPGARDTLWRGLRFLRWAPHAG